MQKSWGVKMLMFAIVCFPLQHLLAQRNTINSKPPMGSPGKCYAKCLIQEEAKNDQRIYPVYIGDNAEENSNVKFEELEITKESERWVKRKRPGCHSVDQNECLLWCLEAGESEYLILPVVVDTSLTTDYEWQRIVQIMYNEESGYTDWREVICANSISPKFINRIQLALRERGYDPGPNSKSIDQPMKAALRLYQKDNSLPLGQLDVDTLKSLKIKRW